MVLAVDKEVIDRGIEVRYRDFTFAEDRQAVLGGEYLEKMVQLPLYLYPLDNTQVRLLVQHHPATGQLSAKQIDLLGRLLVPNPRKVKRVLNILALTRSIAAGAELDFDLVIRLVVLQTQASLLYGDAVALPDLLPALELDYAAAAGQLERGDYKALKLGGTEPRVKELCQKHYADHGPLPTLFEGPAFQTYRKDLRRYLSMVGA